MKYKTFAFVGYADCLSIASNIKHAPYIQKASNSKQELHILYLGPSPSTLVLME